ncbi:uncharacterized protein LOC109611759 [Musca domestica]|uniref:Uncharacterized protein LOC109611759 n=1 Tax=Musca domestica TaxID=7370 RepID=A0A9J7IBQ6_MUSDO|nr:uncharacterized protein LOC109611759 [Musca domestica]
MKFKIYISYLYNVEATIGRISVLFWKHCYKRLYCSFWCRQQGIGKLENKMKIYFVLFAVWVAKSSAGFLEAGHYYQPQQAPPPPPQYPIPQAPAPIADNTPRAYTFRVFHQPQEQQQQYLPPQTTTTTTQNYKIIKVIPEPSQPNVVRVIHQQQPQQQQYPQPAVGSVSYVNVLHAEENPQATGYGGQYQNGYSHGSYVNQQTIQQPAPSPLYQHPHHTVQHQQQQQQQPQVQIPYFKPLPQKYFGIYAKKNGILGKKEIGFYAGKTPSTYASGNLDSKTYSEGVAGANAHHDFSKEVGIYAKKNGLLLGKKEIGFYVDKKPSSYASNYPASNEYVPEKAKGYGEEDADVPSNSDFSKQIGIYAKKNGVVLGKKEIGFYVNKKPSTYSGGYIDFDKDAVEEGKELSDHVAEVDPHAEFLKHFKFFFTAFGGALASGIH